MDSIRSRKSSSLEPNAKETHQATSRSKSNRTQHNQNLDNTQVTNMSSLSAASRLKSSTHHRRSQSESSAEDYGAVQNGNGNGMWRNELHLETESDVAQPIKGKKATDHTSITYEKISDLVDVVARITIVLIFIKLETMTAFKREIHAEELWLYKNPRRPDFVKGEVLLFWVIAAPFLVTLFFLAWTKNRRDFRAASWSWTLALCLNAIPTSLLKVTVGRPRPDYFYRCFPDGIMVLNETITGSSILDFNCTGRFSDINEGRKSFPSGHSSFAFASFGFIAYYVGAKLHAFDVRGRGHTWRQLISIVPFIIAALVAISRTCDYHHHWQDVTVGGVIGLIAGYISYRQYYPSIFSPEAGIPLNRWPQTSKHHFNQQEKYNIQEEHHGDDENGDMLKRPLLSG
ncbi:phospholipid phosphatase 5 isoform X1 [Drosophila tropicalis]|uniref:phospholipid phosphatase 5 isoform X1 n=2 Tax=Drosophila tropicalis TaxID=46794 RepID=UPI0035AB9999